MDALWRHAFVVSGLAARPNGLPGCAWHERHEVRRGPATHRRSTEWSSGAVDGIR